MLQLYMTDGVQEVTGIVFEPIENLYVNTVPGMKVFIKGKNKLQEFIKQCCCGGVGQHLTVDSG